MAWKNDLSEYSGPLQVQSTVTPIIYRLLHHRKLNSGCMSSQGLQRIHGPRWNRASHEESKENPGSGTLSKVDIRAKKGPSLSKSIYFHSSAYVHDLRSCKTCLTCSLLHASPHLYTSKRCQHIENRAQDKRTSLINIIGRISSAGIVSGRRSQRYFQLQQH